MRSRSNGREKKEKGAHWEEVDGEVPAYWSFTARVFGRSLVVVKVTTVFSRRG
jgi:hypothetical protein